MIAGFFTTIRRVKREQHTHSVWKVFALFAIIPLCGLSSCDKARELAGKIKVQSTQTTASRPGEWVTQISAADYDSFRSQPGKVVVIDFYADWCGPCRMLAPILDRLAAENGGRVLVGKVNVDQNRELATREEVRGIPDVRIFRDGREVERFVGLPAEEEVRQRIANQTMQLATAAPDAPENGAPATPEPTIAPAPKDWLPPGMQRR